MMLASRREIQHCDTSSSRYTRRQNSLLTCAHNWLQKSGVWTGYYSSVLATKLIGYMCTQLVTTWDFESRVKDFLLTWDWLEVWNPLPLIQAREVTNPSHPGCQLHLLSLITNRWHLTFTSDALDSTYTCIVSSIQTITFRAMMATEWIGILLVSKGTKINQTISPKSCLWVVKNRLILSGSNTKKLTSGTHDSEQELPKWRQKYNVTHYCYTSQTLFQVCKKQTHETSVPSTKFKTFQILNRVQLLHLPLHAHGSVVIVAQKAPWKHIETEPHQGSWLAQINNQPQKKMQALSVTQSKTLQVCNRRLY